jgi:glutamate/tyrosine decarboxylase-like PLP-dependent enzyme
MPLELSDGEFRALAARVVELAASHLDSLGERPIMPAVSGADATAAFGDGIPEEGLGARAVDDLALVAAQARAGSGGFLGYVLGSGEPVGALGDLFASVLNQNVTAWRSSPSAVTIERALISSLADAIGCAGFAGSLTSGGSLANLMALAMARGDEPRPGAVVYASDEVHMSIPKALALLGLGRASLRRVPTDDRFRISVEALETMVADDRAAGLTPFAIVATAGSTVTGAIDPLARLADVAAANDLWLHVDGAYGAPAALVRPELFDGIGRADSVAVDAHKWLYQPVDLSMLLYRDPAAARRAFSFTDDYARSLSDDAVEGFSFFDESLELSRRFRALKLWLSLRYHGLAAFRAAIANDLAHARLLAELVDADAELELLAPVELSAVCFRVRDAQNDEILRAVNRAGRVYLSNATIRGEFALRACFVNHRTTEDDVRAVVSEVLVAARR